jgi:hypothetical protein
MITICDLTSFIILSKLAKQVYNFNETYTRRRENEPTGDI